MNFKNNPDIKIVSNDEILVKGNRLFKCKPIDIVKIPTKNIPKKEILANVVGIWNKVADIKNGIESSSRFTFYFNSDGSYGYPGSRDNKISTYRVEDSKIFIEKTGQFPKVDEYIVRDITSKQMLLEVVNPKRPDLEYILKLEISDSSQ